MGNFFTAVSIGLGVLLVGILLELFRVTLRSIRRRLSLGKAAIKIDVLPVDLEKDRREHRKVAIHWPVVLESAGMKTRATARDISLGGAFVACDRPFDLNQRFQMSVEVPGRRPLALNAQVVWTNTSVPEAEVVTRGMGVKFVWNPEKTLSYLRDTIASCLSEGEKQQWLSGQSPNTQTPAAAEAPADKGAAELTVPAGV